MSNKVLKGSLLIALGACCYGMLGIYVKMAYRDGFNTAEVTISQFCLGFAGLFVLSLFRRQESAATINRSGFRSKLKLTMAGTSLGLTSIFYYMSVKYIAVSIAIVLLMQTVWMGLVFEMIALKRRPEKRKLLSAFIVMIGTVLATNILWQSADMNWVGCAFGVLAAICYTATMYSSNHIEIQFAPLKRSLYMILGGLIMILLVFHSSINDDFSYRIFVHWGLVVSLFGTILPPLLFTRGMPLTGVGMGAIVAALEIPVAVMMANILLNESVSTWQWTGVALILIAVLLMNIPQRKAPGRVINPQSFKEST